MIANLLNLSNALDLAAPDGQLGNKLAELIRSKRQEIQAQIDREGSYILQIDGQKFRLSRKAVVPK